MALKAVFSAMKREGYIVKDLDLYLLSLNATDEDRAIDVNAPSQAGTCMRARYYARTGAPRDYGSVDARTRRIFDNGTKTHERLQEYLLKQGMLLMDEVPVHNYEYNIQGHTDGVLKLSASERGILEIKSINSNGFASLKGAKEEHRKQGLIYIFCLEERRKYLQNAYKTKEAFNKSKSKRMREYAELYQHLKDGKKFTREEKIQFQCELHDKMDSILYETRVPITKAVFLYENKDTQDLKEFTVSMTEASSKTVLAEVLGEYAELNDYVENEELPERCAKNKSDPACRWCSFKTECWN